MNKKQFVSCLYQKLKSKATTDKNKQKKYAAEITEIFFQSVADSLKVGDKVDLRGFGVFQAKEYKFHNKKTTSIKVRSSKKFPVFKMSKIISRKLNSDTIYDSLD